MPSMLSSESNVGSSSSSASKHQTPQEQLAERRERLKRKAEDELRASQPRTAGGRFSPTLVNADRKGKSREAPVPLPVPSAIDETGHNEESRTIQRTELDLDMLLDGLGMDESLKQMAKDDPMFREELISQLMTIPLPEDGENAGNGEEGFDLDEIDDEAGMEDYEFDPRIIYGPPRPPIPFRFRDGALRMTRTPGRAERNTLNCISMEELIDKDSLIACCCFAFFISENEFFRYLPIQPQAKVPIYVGRDVNLDPVAPQVMKALGEEKGFFGKGKISARQLDKIKPYLTQAYRKRYGEKYHPFYPRCAGCAHSKILLLVYPTYLRLVITSCNFMNIDLREGDNHWYIHDLPRYASNKALSPNTSFEKLFTVHLRDLNVPSTFFHLHFSGRFDFSRIKVHLLTSRPGLSSGILSESSGLLRLNKIVSEYLTEERKEIIRDGMHLEICSGSIGHLNDKWLKEFFDCAGGKKRLTLAKLDCDIPSIEIVFPTYTDVEKCDELARTVAAKNIGCHMNWGNAREEIRRLFMHYKSKDPGKLFHMKLLIATNSKDYHALPFYIYIGSANFSNGAWGRLGKAPKGDKTSPPGSLRVEQCVNYECGVIIPRSVLMTLLEPGSEWQDIIPYDRPAKPYNIQQSDGSNMPYLKNPNAEPDE